VFGAYLQDDIRVRSGLNLSLGGRYEMATVPRSAHRLSNLCADRRPAAFWARRFSKNPTLRNFERESASPGTRPPAARPPSGPGFGMFDVLPLPYEFTLTIPYTTPFSQTISVDVFRRILFHGGVSAILW